MSYSTTGQTENPIATEHNLKLSIFGWCLALSFAPQIILDFVVSVTLAIYGLNIYETKDPQIEVMVTVATCVLSPLIFLPMSSTHQNLKQRPLLYRLSFHFEQGKLDV